MPGSVVSAGLLLFAATAPTIPDHVTSAEEVTFSLFKVIGIISAVAIGSWTTSRKLKAIEDAITAEATHRALLKVQMDSMQRTIRNLTCFNAPSCRRRAVMIKKAAKGKRPR